LWADARFETRTKECIYIASLMVENQEAEWKRNTSKPKGGRWDPHIVLELELYGYDPKDGDLCLVWRKSMETLMDGLSGADVQIAHSNWV